MFRMFLVLGFVVLLVGCASSGAPSPTPTPDVAAAAERRDTTVEELLEQRAQAAAAGDRDTVNRAEEQLDELAGQADDADVEPSDDPFLAVVQSFQFKQAPLYVQQIQSSVATHELFVRVNRDAFCLMRPETRLTAVEAVYGPAAARVSNGGVDDFEFVLTPIDPDAPGRSDALALGRDGQAELTPAGRDCE